MSEKFDHWAIVDVMGHQRIAGRVREQTLGGQAFIRVDVPACGPVLPFTKLLGGASIYSISPCTEEVARMVAEQLHVQPITAYDLPSEIRERIQRPALAAPAAVPEYQEYDDGDA